jgi:hypothetical protein
MSPVQHVCTLNQPTGMTLERKAVIVLIPLQALNVHFGTIIRMITTRDYGQILELPIKLLVHLTKVSCQVAQKHKQLFTKNTSRATSYFHYMKSNVLDRSIVSILHNNSSPCSTAYCSSQQQLPNRTSQDSCRVFNNTRPLRRRLRSRTTILQSFRKQTISRSCWTRNKEICHGSKQNGEVARRLEHHRTGTSSQRSIH